MDLVHCIYCSASSKANVTRPELDALLKECRVGNEPLGVTGMLLYRDGAFFQVLEGDRPVVEALFAKVERDKRHTKVTKITIEPIAERAFAQWSMGYSNIASKELAQIPGLNDFFTRGDSYLNIGESKAKLLLAAFKEGKWRVSLS
ncbi:MAG: BLUF domain-containing protein [Gammaproteobacteria bacterium]